MVLRLGCDPFIVAELFGELDGGRIPGLLQSPLLKTRAKRLETLGGGPRQFTAGRDQHLPGPQPLEFVRHESVRALSHDLRGTIFAGGQIYPRHAPAPFLIGASRRQAREVAAFLVLDEQGVAHSPRRENADDFAPDDSLPFRGSTHLLAYRHLVARFEEAGRISVSRMKGNAAHRDGCAVRVLLSRGQGKFERLRGDVGVLVEHLEEIAHLEKKDGVGMAAFYI